MKILAIDTSSDSCSCAILEDSKLVKQINLKDEKTHSQKLMPIIDELVTKCNYTIKDFDLFACSKGPGSFTGIRIGIATIKAFSDATDKPLVGISSLKGLAYNIYPPECNSLIVSIIDAKHDNVYYGIFKNENNIYKKTANYSFDSINTVLNNLSQLKNEFIFVGNGGIIYKDVIQSKLANRCKFINNDELNDCKAYSIGLAAYHKYLSGNITPIVPLYLKKSSAELLLEDKNK